MTTKNITIAISGEIATGKSRLAYLINKTLKEKGFEVNLINNMDFPNEKAFNEHMERNFDDAIEAIAEKTKVTIVQAQVMRSNENK